VNALTACVKSGIAKSFAIKNADCGTISDSIGKKRRKEAAILNRNVARTTVLLNQETGRPLTRHHCRRVQSIEKKRSAPGGIRTPDPQVRSLLLYPAELRARAEESGT
jgi:hypothetical protein